MTTAYIGIGSNVGDREAFVRRGVDEIGASEGITLEKVSSLYATAPIGGPPQRSFINLVVKIDTTLSPRELLDTLQIAPAEARTRSLKPLIAVGAFVTLTIAGGVSYFASSAPDGLGARIFERAISGHNSTGIGLAVARDLAEADGGRLEMLQATPAVFGLFLSRTPPQKSPDDEPRQTVR